MGAAPGFADAHLGGRAGVFRDSAPAEPRGQAAMKARGAVLLSSPSALLAAREGSANRIQIQPASRLPPSVTTLGQVYQASTASLLSSSSRQFLEKALPSIARHLRPSCFFHPFSAIKTTTTKQT